MYLRVRDNNTMVKRDLIENYTIQLLQCLPSNAENDVPEHLSSRRDFFCLRANCYEAGDREP